MHLGIDFGTTRTVVAQADRGNFPIVGFNDESGDAHEFWPSLIALGADGLVCGFEARRAQREHRPVLRSVKRLLASPAVNTATEVAIGGERFRLLDVLVTYLTDLREALHSGSTVARLLPDDPLESVVVAVPAHAHSAQRFLTLEAFRQAGFEVSAMMNEPSAAGFEYTHRLHSSPSTRRSRLVVYDLGGGTFDASLVAIHDRSHAVLGSIGVNRLGGDDFDLKLADLACRQAGVNPEELGLDQYFRLLDDAQAAKEQLAPQSRRIVLDVAERPVTVAVSDYYEVVGPLIEQSVGAMTPLVAGLDRGEPEMDQIAGLYLVGGASSLPLVPRLLRERFGRRVYRSPYPAASAAIGLAIASDPASDYTLSDRLSRGFGVFREADSGTRLVFDPIFDRDLAIDAGTEVTASRRYRAAHNIGWYRFAEYAELSDSQPVGDIVPLNDIVFPCRRDLQDTCDELDSMEVVRTDDGDEIEETYLIDAHGIVSVQITDLDTGYTTSQQLGLG